jgi:hypothetical protein
MPEPKSHAEKRPGLEQLVRHIPAFRGYLEKSYRRESDALTRTMLADRLDQAKRSLEGIGRKLVDAKRLSELTELDRVGSALTRVSSRIRGAMQGYSGVFDLVKIDESVLDRVYGHDLALIDEVDAIRSSIQQLDIKNDSLRDAVDGILQKVDALDQAWNKRAEILQGVD